ncbi:MAG: hypothetical protein AAGB26_17110 [Planctomycetota bacterium]
MFRAIKTIPSRIVRWCLRHKVWTAVIVLLGVLSITPIIIITRTWFIIHADDRPAAMPAGYVLEEQTEGFTCGVHSLSTVYKAYGLDPEAERIRWRLGVDTKAVAWMGDSTGALHPDMWMVLAQDFFIISLLRDYGEEGWQNLCAHLDLGHPAVLLIKRRENGNLHWVVATRTLENDTIEVYDSLFDEPYKETPDFMTDHIVTAMLVRPSTTGEQATSSIDAHLAGMDALDEAARRIKALEQD